MDPCPECARTSTHVCSQVGVLTGLLRSLAHGPGQDPPSCDWVGGCRPLPRVESPTFGVDVKPFQRVGGGTGSVYVRSEPLHSQGFPYALHVLLSVSVPPPWGRTPVVTLSPVSVYWRPTGLRTGGPGRTFATSVPVSVDPVSSVRIGFRLSEGGGAVRIGWGWTRGAWGTTTAGFWGASSRTGPPSGRGV